ncbi:hypothetical protein AB0K60_15315 [Thermopolyspora sp. NPDC052614]|uniref:hypothetical protein n=1 Tax=Thermopolyspora sp. NPDC052614 TaxID=3155682 RepID=UPI003441F90D
MADRSYTFGLREAARVAEDGSGSEDDRELTRLRVVGAVRDDVRRAAGLVAGPLADPVDLVAGPVDLVVGTAAGRVADVAGAEPDGAGLRGADPGGVMAGVTAGGTTAGDEAGDGDAVGRTREGCEVGTTTEGTGGAALGRDGVAVVTSQIDEPIRTMAAAPWTTIMPTRSRRGRGVRAWAEDRERPPPSHGGTSSAAGPAAVAGAASCPGSDGPSAEPSDRLRRGGSAGSRGRADPVGQPS